MKERQQRGREGGRRCEREERKKEGRKGRRKGRKRKGGREKENIEEEGSSVITDLESLKM